MESPEESIQLARCVFKSQASEIIFRSVRTMQSNYVTFFSKSSSQKAKDLKFPKSGLHSQQFLDLCLIHGDDWDFMQFHPRSRYFNVMDCENNHGSRMKRSCSLGNVQTRDISAHRRNGGEEKGSQKEPSLVLWKVKEREGRSACRLARFIYCNIAIKVVVYDFGFLSGPP